MNYGSLNNLQPFVGEPAKPRQEQSRQDQPRKQTVRREKRQPVRQYKNQGPSSGTQPFQNHEADQQVSNHFMANDESEDLTEEDLRRLRGEMPLTNSSKKKWKQ